MCRIKMGKVNVGLRPKMQTMRRVGEQKMRHTLDFVRCKQSGPFSSPQHDTDAVSLKQMSDSKRMID